MVPVKTRMPIAPAMTITEPTVKNNADNKQLFFIVLRCYTLRITFSRVMLLEDMDESGGLTAKKYSCDW